MTSGSHNHQRGGDALSWLEDQARSARGAVSQWLDSDGGQGILSDAARVADWLREHEPEIITLGQWSSIGIACEESGLYTPPHDEAWEAITKEINSRNLDVADLIISLYAPSGPAFASLRDELLCAPVLKSRRAQLAQVLDSLVERCYYLTICSVLPLIEYVISAAAGKWRQPDKHDLEARLEADDFTDDEQDALFADMAAVLVFTRSIPEIWESRSPPKGGETADLNRQLALHGNAYGWDTVHNAMRAVLLLAATVRAAPLLLTPPPSES
jgi:hypothetical protein